MAARDVGCDRRGELARGAFGPPAYRLVRRTKGWADERQRRADALGRARKVGFACARAPACLVWADTSGDLAISSVVRVVERGRIMGDRIPNQLSCSPSLMHRSLDTRSRSRQRGNVPPYRGPDPPPSARIDPTHPSHHPGPLPGHRMPSPLSPAPEFPTRGLFSIPIPCSLVMCPQRDIWPPQVAAPAPRIPAMQPRPLMTAGASPPLLVCLSLSCPAGTTRPTRASRRRRGAMAETTPPPSQSLAARAR